MFTFNSLIQFVTDSDATPASRKRSMRWALNRARALVGHGLADVRLEPRTLLRQLDQLSPAMAGLTPQSLANLKTHIRAAQRLAAPHLPQARSYIKLEGEWATLEARLPLRERRQLSRFIRFSQALGWLPHEIRDEHVARFKAYLRDEAMLPEYEKVARATRRAWNRAMNQVPGWPDRPLTPPQPKKAPYWLRLEELPSSLQEEIGDTLYRLEHPDPFLGRPGKALSPATVQQFRILFITVASALVASGVPAGELTTVASLVRPAHFERALRFLHARAGHRVNEQIHQLAYRARKVGAHAGLSEQELARLDDILASVKREHPVEPGLTKKNRHLLAHLDDPAFVDRLLAFPARLMQAAKAASCIRYGASYARDAVAVELLLTCSMRVANLVDLRVGESIRRFGEGRNARWAIDIPVEKVKNKQPLRFTLLPESGRLVEAYLADWQPYWCGPGTPWLFPGKRGGHVNPRLLTIMIGERARKYVGVRITCHQFRHLAAELYLQEDPMGLGVVSQHLGHRKFDTTRTYYAREQSRLATQRYHEVLTRKRAQAPSRPLRRPEPTGVPA